MPYLTLWDKISQNLAHLEANSHKIFQISKNFQPIFQQILWRNKHKSVVFITSFLQLNKSFWLILGSSKVIFVKFSQNYIKSPLKICLISQAYAWDFKAWGWESVCSLHFRSKWAASWENLCMPYVNNKCTDQPVQSDQCLYCSLLR